MAIKFLTVVSFFMHLKFDNKMFSCLFYSGLFLAVCVYVAALDDVPLLRRRARPMLGATFADPWRFQANPEVYLLVAFLIGAYVYSVRVIGPRASCPTASRSSAARNIGCFAGAMALLFAASTGRSTRSARTTSTRCTCCST